MFDFIPLEYYTGVYYWIMASLCLVTGLNYSGSNNCSKLLRQNSGLFPLLFTIIITLYIGLRPISGKYFADMGMYAHGYRMCNPYSFSGFFNIKTEWLFEFIMKTCKLMRIDINVWFLIIDIIYVGCHIWACKRLLRENIWMALLFVCFSYQFWSFGTNGLRNGMGAAIMIVAISYFCENTKKGNFIGLFCFLLAMGCHRSVMIPMAAIIVSKFVIKDIRHAILIWVLCILFSVVSGRFFINLFSSIGLDDRMEGYAMSSATKFSHMGFRWDFLLYSAMPVWFAWYVESKGIRDRTFSLISNIYIIANSFWVLICRIPFSNRFAYLSWYLYAMVLAYGVVRVPIWKDQDRKAGWILILHAMFSLVMMLIGK